MNTLDEYIDALAAALIARKAFRDAQYVMSHTTDAHIMLHPRQATLARAEAEYAAAIQRLEAAMTARQLEHARDGASREGV